jgi:hypothetical protein
MSILIDPTQLSARRKRVMDDIAKLQKEADEIDMLLRLAGRYSGKPPEKGKPKAKGKPAKVPRPPGTPSTLEMVEMILAGAEKDGRGPLTSREIMDDIRAKYWPGVQNGQILPSIFGYRDKGLIREGDKWRRGKK